MSQSAYAVQRFEEFWPHYVRMHTRPETHAWHAADCSRASAFSRRPWSRATRCSRRSDPWSTTASRRSATASSRPTGRRPGRTTSGTRAQSSGCSAWSFAVEWAPRWRGSPRRETRALPLPLHARRRGRHADGPGGALRADHRARRPAGRRERPRASVRGRRQLHREPLVRIPRSRRDPRPPGAALRVRPGRIDCPQRAGLRAGPALPRGACARVLGTPARGERRRLLRVELSDVRTRLCARAHEFSRPPWRPPA